MNFIKWIETQGGPRVVARKLGYESPAVHAWIKGVSSPKALAMQKIVRMSKGKVSYDDIINATKKRARR